jgi:hypothetical protein
VQRWGQFAEYLVFEDHAMLGIGDFIDGFSPPGHASSDSETSLEPFPGTSRITGADCDYIGNSSLSKQLGNDLEKIDTTWKYGHGLN